MIISMPIQDGDDVDGDDGEVVDNFKLIDEIAAVQKDEFNRPLEDVKMVITAKKTRKKKITRVYGYKYEKKK